MSNDRVFIDIGGTPTGVVVVCAVCGDTHALHWRDVDAQPDMPNTLKRVAAAAKGEILKELGEADDDSEVNIALQGVWMCEEHAFMYPPEGYMLFIGVDLDAQCNGDVEVNDRTARVPVNSCITGDMFCLERMDSLPEHMLNAVAGTGPITSLPAHAFKQLVADGVFKHVITANSVRHMRMS